MSDGKSAADEGVFIVSIQGTEIVFCPQTNQIISRFDQDSASSARQGQGESPHAPDL